MTIDEVEAALKRLDAEYYHLMVADDTLEETEERLWELDDEARRLEQYREDLINGRLRARK